MQESEVSTGNFEQCVKCTICNTVCPMMAANPAYPGPKQAGPDGERYRLKDPAFFDMTLKYCLNCKRCEVSCPSGVKVGDLIQAARLKYGRQHNPLRDKLLASTDLVGGLSVPLAPVVNRALSRKLVRRVLDKPFGVSREKTLPQYSGVRFDRWMAGGIDAPGLGVAPSQEGFDRYVTYFHGCYVNYQYPQLGRDLVVLLNACGYGVRLMDDERCCGVALLGNGFGTKAAKQARRNVSAMKKALSGGSEAILTTSSTCTFTMRDEYDHLLGIDVSELRGSLMMAVRWLYRRIEAGEVTLVFRDGFRMRAAYHTACHMNKLGWAIYSVGLLRRIPGMELTLLDQECCGMAGTFGFKKENYGYSQTIGDKLFGLIRAADPEAVICDCETCKWQIEEGTGLPVINPVSLLVQALDLEATASLNRHKNTK